MKIANIQLPKLSYLLHRISQYMDPLSKKTGIKKWRLFVSYCYHSVVYGCTPLEYTQYHYYEFNRHRKKQFINTVRQRKYERAHIVREKVKYIGNKENALVLFHDYVQRPWCGVCNHNSDADFVSFCHSQTTGVLKPIGNYGGHGIEFISLDGISPAELKAICQKRRAIVEAPIIQHPELSRLNPSSVNTIRIMTVDAAVIGAALRMGVGKSRLDNASSGGIYAEVDIETGMVISKAVSDACDSFLIHPNTGIVVPGLVIPMWEDCKRLAESAAKLIPEISLIGWDIALTEDGPTLVEANHDPGLDLIQAPNLHGLAHCFLSNKKG